MGDFLVQYYMSWNGAVGDVVVEVSPICSLRGLHGFIDTKGSLLASLSI
jgi:hypothetical protein